MSALVSERQQHIRARLIDDLTKVLESRRQIAKKFLINDRISLLIAEERDLTSSCAFGNQKGLLTPHLCISLS